MIHFNKIKSYFHLLIVSIISFFTVSMTAQDSVIIESLDHIYKSLDTIENIDTKKDIYLYLRKEALKLNNDSLYLVYSMDYLKNFKSLNTTASSPNTLKVEYESLLFAARKSKNVILLARIHTHLSYLYRINAEYYNTDSKKAKYHAKKVFHLIAKDTNPTLSFLKSKAILECYVKEKNDSLFYYLDNLGKSRTKSYERIRNYYLMSWYRNQKDHKKELFYAKKYHDPHEQLVAYRNNHMHKEVDSLYQILLKKNFSDLVKSILDINMATSYVQRGKLKKAETFFLRALSYVEEHNGYEQYIEIYHKLRDLYERQNKNKELVVLQDRFIKFRTKITQDRLKDENIQLSMLNEIKQFEEDLYLQKMAAQNEANQSKLFKQRTTFYSSIIGLLLLLLGGFWYYRDKKMKLDLKSEISDMKIEVFRSQFKPHFTFNILNVVNYFIAKRQEKEAALALERITHLMRGTIDNLRSDFIEFEKELSLCKDYLYLESLRFEDKYTYTIQELPEDDITANWLVPPGIIEPFIENSVNHAFKGTSKKGKIEISFQQEEDQLIIYITDNGIGFDKNSAFKQNSHGLNISRDRLHTLSKYYNANFGLHIETNNGTKVSVTIPHIQPKIET